MPGETRTTRKLTEFVRVCVAACGNVAPAGEFPVTAIALPVGIGSDLLQMPVASAFHSRAVIRVLLIVAAVFLIPLARAQQTPPNQTMPTVVTCTSKKGERQVCQADTTAGVALLRSTGESNCLLGNTWGYDSAGVISGTHTGVAPGREAAE